MHIVEVNHGAGELHRYLLLPDAVYTVGRKECHILLPTGDPSISRHHTNVHVGVMQSRALTDPLAPVAEISLQDNSKHGTFVNDELVGRGNSRYVYTEDSVRFGKKVTARMVSVRVVLVESTQLLNEERKTLRNLALMLGALVVQEPAPPLLNFFDIRLNCIAFLYITHDSYSVTPETLLAQQQGYHITTLKYLQLLERVLSDDCAKGMEQLPQPIAAVPGDTCFPVAEYMRPPKTFYDMHEFLLLKPPANKLLRGYTFTFVDVDVMNRNNQLIRCCGARVVRYSTQENQTAAQSPAPTAENFVVTSDAAFPAMKRALAASVYENGVVEVSTGGTVHGMSDALGEMGDSESYLLDESTMAMYASLYRSGFNIIPEENIKRAAFTGNRSEIGNKALVSQLVCEDEDAIRSSTPVLRSISPIISLSNETLVTPSHREESTEPAGSAAALSVRGFSPPVESPPRQGLPSAVSGRALQELEGNILNATENSKSTSEKQMEAGTKLLISAVISGAPNTLEANLAAKKKQRRKFPSKQASEERSHEVESNSYSHSARSQRRNREKSPDVVRIHWDPQTATICPTAEQLWKRDFGRISSYSRPRINGYRVSQQIIPSTPTTVSASPSSGALGIHSPLERQASGCNRTSFRLVRSMSPLSKRSGASRGSSCKGGTRLSGTRLPTGEESGGCGGLGSASNYSPSVCNTARNEPNSGRPARRHAFASRQRSTARDKIGEAKTARLPTSPLRSHSTVFQRLDSGTGSGRRTIGGRVGMGQRTDSVRAERIVGLLSSGGLTGASSGCAALAQQQDATIRKRCEEFLRKTLNPFSAEVETTCRLITKQKYLDASSKKSLEDGIEGVIKFLAYVQRIETSIPQTQSTHTTRGITNQVRQKALVLRRRIKSAYEAVRAEIPPWMTQLREVLSGRPMGV
uniref:Putative recombination initiation protein NBS1 n=1 Tax=Trypanosoma congolense (strain IL3000) TaxID=1068625 RepID=G0USG4_TRYCI|nr:putative recombination initiation protein NBS1 [Trypanosoma congolense IL3000]